MDIFYKSEITATETNAIRKAMGRRQLHPAQVQANLNAYAHIVAAYASNHAVAMAGLLWGGGSFAAMHILINPAHQMQGIEEEFVTRIFSFLRSKLEPGFGIQVDIFVQGEQQAQYEALGFQPITPANRGIPMQICLTNQIEQTDRLFSQMDYKEK